MGKISVILIGSQGAGKTSIADALNNKMFNPNQEESISVSIPSLIQRVGGNDLQLFDASGAERYLSTIKSHVKGKDVIVLCIDSSAPDSLTYADDIWLNYLAQQNIKTPILLVLTKTDKNSAVRSVGLVDLQNLKDKYGNELNMLDSVPTSAQKNQIDTLREALDGIKSSYNPAFYDYLKTKITDIKDLITYKKNKEQNGLFAKKDDEVTLEVNTLKTLKKKITTLHNKRDCTLYEEFYAAIKTCVNETKLESPEGFEKNGGKYNFKWARPKPRIEKFTDDFLMEASKTFGNNNNNNNNNNNSL